jgi:hypothetical protein
MRFKFEDFRMPNFRQSWFFFFRRETSIYRITYFILLNSFLSFTE